MKTEELKNRISRDNALLVYFYSDTCAPCVALRPKVTGMLDVVFPKMETLMVDAVEFPETAASFNAFALPVLVIFFEGKEYKRFSKYVSLSELEASIRRVYDLYFED